MMRRTPKLRILVVATLVLGVACSSGVILATTDGGRTWLEQFSRPAPAR
jgi:photosystem II stability/assembly factor-like uncharacterized protein